MDNTQQTVAQSHTYTVVMRYEMAYTMQVKGENEKAAEAEAFTEFHKGNGNL
ncbi:hypothetical protein [Paenibacillus favisporus]|uniref:hypothetical protein n=1 Tax=Paenibacillus favisporus TaxID=221028 RepID=UPI0013D0D5CD|nr:hypothetical protein [Paenibacillus favisporus]